MNDNPFYCDEDGEEDFDYGYERKGEYYAAADNYMRDASLFMVPPKLLLPLTRDINSSSRRLCEAGGDNSNRKLSNNDVASLS